MLTAIATVVVAWFGLWTWKLQLTGVNEHNLAKRILVLCYQYRDAIAMVRHPAMTTSEMHLSPDDDPSTMDERQIRAKGTQNAYAARWEHINLARSALYPELLEAEVLWGTTLNDLMKPLYRLQGTLFVTVQGLLEGMRDPHANDWKTPADHTRDRAALYAGANPDTFADEFQAGLDPISEYLGQKLKRMELPSPLKTLQAWIHRKGEAKTSSSSTAK